MLEPGRTVGRYTVDAQIGQGGMAAVYRAHDPEGRQWALKVLIQRNDDLRERFCQEAEIQCALDHPHIVRGRERIFVDEDPALVMELVEGRPLDVWLLRDARPLTDPAAIRDRDRISRQMVDAVGFAHAHGLIHRDLKPGNILIEDRPDGPFAKVTDFGLAKQLDGLIATRTGIALGTPRYMAPEQIRDAKRVDARADIWSLGAVLFEMYSGQPAFHRDALIDIYTAVVDGDYPDPVALGLPPRICDAIRGALKVEPSERFPDCRALLQALGVEPSFPPGALPLPVLPSPGSSGSVRPRISAPGRPEAAPADPSLVPPLHVPPRVPLAQQATVITSSPLPASLEAPPPPLRSAVSLTDAPVRGELPSSKPKEEPVAPPDTRASVTLLPPLSDPELSPQPLISPPPAPSAALEPAPTPPPARRPPHRSEARPMLTWIVAWAAALLLVVGTFVTGMVVLGGLVTVNQLLDEPPARQAPPHHHPRRGGRR